MISCIFTGEHGSVGMKLSNEKELKEEIVLSLQTGDVIPVPLGAVSWWYNYGKSDVIILFLGKTTNAYVPGEFTYFLLTGALGVLGSFSTEFTSKAYKINEKEANILVKSQTGVLIVKLDPEEGKRMPIPQKHNSNKWVKNITNISPNVHVEKAGIATSFTGAEFPFLEEVGLTCSIVKLEANAVLSPIYTTDSSVLVFYVAKGSGKVQIVGVNGKLALDNKLEAGQLFIVPRLFVVSITASHGGMECFYINTTTW